MNLVDTHAHLDFNQFDEDRDQVLARAMDAGVTRLINVGTSLGASERSVELAEAHECVWAAVGVHPSDAGELVSAGDDTEGGAVKQDAVARLRKLAYHKRVVAVGEIGFDFHHQDSPPKFVQGDAFLAQSAIAEEAGLPIIVHFRGPRDAGVDEDTGYALACLSEYADRLVANDPLRRWPGVVHCYTGDLDDAKRLLEAGYYISFTAPVTYPKNDALREVVKAVPLEKIMVETDCPFLPPPERRGQRNEPAYVVGTAKKIAEIKGILLDEVARVTTENARRLFGLD
ncbi:MAG: TatD family hydrolase [Patescibacteria group bacterium]